MHSVQVFVYVILAAAVLPLLLRKDPSGSPAGRGDNADGRRSSDWGGGGGAGCDFAMGDGSEGSDADCSGGGGDFGDGGGGCGDGGGGDGGGG